METLVNGHSTVDSAKKAGRQIAKETRNLSSEAMDRVEDIASNVQEVVQARLSQLMDTAATARTSAEAQVRRHPLSYVLGAAVCGIALGVAYSFIRPSKR